MKKRVLSINRTLSDIDVPQIVFWNPRAISDFDALIIDPKSLYLGMYQPPTMKTPDGGFLTNVTQDHGHGQRIASLFDSRKDEAGKLLTVTKGLLVCFLRKQEAPLNIITRSGTRSVTNYSWLPDLTGFFGGTMRATYALANYFRFKESSGTQITLVKPTHPFAQYFKAFRNEIEFESTIEIPPPLGQTVNVLALNKVGETVACEIPLGGGNLIFIPATTSSNQQKETEVLLSCIATMFNNSYATLPPAWAKDYMLPGEAANNEDIQKLSAEIGRLEAEKSSYESKRDYSMRFKGLLYEKGKIVLEPLVRAAFRELGFEVVDPDTYPEEYDVYFHNGEIAVIGEVEGKDNSKVDVDKLRQLMDYLDQESKKGAKTKGILISNAYCGTPPGQREAQFSERAQERAGQLGYCLITTCQLYDLLVRKFSGIDNDELLRIRQSILKCVGLYSP